MSRCDEIQGHLDDWLDDVLEPAEQENVAAHLQDCAVCRRLFGQHQAIAKDLWSLGQAADRLASAPTVGKRVGPHWRSALRIAAAVLLVVTTGIVALQYRHAGRPMPTPPGPGVLSGEARVSRSSPKESPTANEAPSEFSVTVDDSYMAVRMKSSNPRIQIVWLYPMVQPSEPEGDDDDGDINDVSSG